MAKEKDSRRLTPKPLMNDMSQVKSNDELDWNEKMTEATREVFMNAGRKLLAQLTTLQSQLAQAVRERDDAIREANRRDQKWMDGINEAVGRKLDYGDPCSRDNASKALGQFAQQLTQAHKERDEAVERMKEAEWLLGQLRKENEELKREVAQLKGFKVEAPRILDERDQLRSVLKECVELLNEIWEEDEMGWLTLDCESTFEECVKCGAHKVGSNEILHADDCLQGKIHKVLATAKSLKGGAK